MTSAIALDEHPTELVTQALRAGRRVVFVARGGSMEPTLPDGTRVAIDPARRVRRGDLAAVERPDGGVAIHRVVATTPDGRVTTWGDAMPAPDPWGPCQPLGYATPSTSDLGPPPQRPRWRRLLGALRVVVHLVAAAGPTRG